MPTLKPRKCKFDVPGLEQELFYAPLNIAESRKLSERLQELRIERTAALAQDGADIEVVSRDFLQKADETWNTALCEALNKHANGDGKWSLADLQNADRSMLDRMIAQLMKESSMVVLGEALAAATTA